MALKCFCPLSVRTITINARKTQHLNLSVLKATRLTKVMCYFSAMGPPPLGILGIAVICLLFASTSRDRR